MTAEGLGTAVHVIPYDGIGGVEVAARSLTAGHHCAADGTIDFVKVFLARRGAAEHGSHIWTGPKSSESAPTNYITALCEIRRRRPDLLIASLWRSCIVALLAKAARPRLKLVAFLHLAETVHLPDRVLNRLVMELAEEIWTDGESTLEARLPRRLRQKGRVISFLTERLERATQAPVAPRFIFWGRLHGQKGLERALDIFARVVANHPDAKFTLIGPDMGARAALEAHSRALGVSERVRFTGPLEREEIFRRTADYSFFLQPSLTEGMAMSVVEAMQLGLIPLVAPVGEIPRYCRDGENALFLPAGAAADACAARIAALLDAPDRAEQMARAAHEVWMGQELYRNDVLAACGDILGRGRPGRKGQGCVPERHG